MKWLRNDSADELRQALFSDDEKYRYVLDICVLDKPLLPIIGFNPSTATHEVNDATIRRGLGFAADLGFGGLRMMNLYNIRSRDPKTVFESDDPFGEFNNVHLYKGFVGEYPVAAWGTLPFSKEWPHSSWPKVLANALEPNLRCFRKTKEGHPAHILYLPKGLTPMEFSYKS